MNRKNGCLAFCTACGFGAGQMYLGYMRRGVSIMLLAVLDIFLCSFFNNTAFGIFLPVIWAFAFFDTFNLRNQITPRPDEFLLDLSGLAGRDWKRLMNRRHSLIGWVLVGVGVYALYNNFVAPTLMDIALTWNLVWLGNFLYGLPTLLVAALLIGLGLYLLRSPDGEEKDDDYVAFKGGEHHEHE